MAPTKRALAVSASSPSPPSILSDSRSTSPAQNTQAEVAKQSWHFLMWIPMFLLLPAAAISTHYITEQVAERTAHMAENPGKYNWTYPKFIDLMTTFYSLLVLIALRLTLCRYVFTPLGNYILPTVAEKKGKWTEAAREDRVQRFSVCMFKLCYFIGITIFGYETLKDTTWLPPQLLGHGSVMTAWNEWPYSEISEPVKRYYLIALSYHAHSLVFHLATTHRNDFIEMTLHHTCAILLVVFSYFTNFVRLGSLVLFLHDIADVMAYSVKAVVDTKYTKITLMAYAGLLVSWGYTRLYVLPIYVVIGVSTIPGMGHSFVWWTLYFMIWLLQLLHVYWYILFLIMGYRFLISGKTVDIQQKAGEKDGSYVDYHKAHVDEEVDGEPSGSPHADLASGQEEESELSPVVKPRPVRTRSQKKASNRAE